MELPKLMVPNYSLCIAIQCQHSEHLGQAIPFIKLIPPVEYIALTIRTRSVDLELFA